MLFVVGMILIVCWFLIFSNEEAVKNNSKIAEFGIQDRRSDFLSSVTSLKDIEKIKWTPFGKPILVIMK